MKQISAGAFNAHCQAVMNQVQAAGEPVIVTKGGAPMVKVAPAVAANHDIFGFMAREFKVVGDVESAIVPLKMCKK
jgi:antitoxin (DNA-binding transcriptional repressor) of toxin-antitoxin stability system